MQFRLKSPRLWLPLALLLSTPPAQATEPPPPAAPTPPRACQMMLKTMQHLSAATLDRACAHWDDIEHGPSDYQYTYLKGNQPHLRLNALPQSCIAAWVEQKLREDPAGCELSESTPEAKELRQLLLQRALPQVSDRTVKTRAAASYLLCLQQVPEALPLFIENALGINPEDACVAALFSAPQADGPAQDARRAYVVQALDETSPPRQLFVPSAFGSESARLALVPLLDFANRLKYRGRDQLAQLVCEPAPTLPTLTEVCYSQGHQQEPVWQLMEGVTGPALLTGEQVETVLKSLSTDWQSDPLRARQQIEQLCSEYQQKTEALTQRCQELRRQQELWLPVASFQRHRLNEALEAAYNSHKKTLQIALWLMVHVALLAGPRMLRRERPRRSSQPPR